MTLKPYIPQPDLLKPSNFATTLATLKISRAMIKTAKSKNKIPSGLIPTGIEKNNHEVKSQLKALKKLIVHYGHSNQVCNLEFCDDLAISITVTTLKADRKYIKRNLNFYEEYSSPKVSKYYSKLVKALNIIIRYYGG